MARARACRWRGGACLSSGVICDGIYGIEGRELLYAGLARFNVTAVALSDSTIGKVKYFEGTPVLTSILTAAPRLKKFARYCFAAGEVDSSAQTTPGRVRARGRILARPEAARVSALAKQDTATPQKCSNNRSQSLSCFSSSGMDSTHFPHLWLQ